MKLCLFIPIFCVGMVILTLVTLYQTREPDSERLGPFRRRAVVEENRGAISRLLSKIASYFKPKPVIILEEEIEITKDIPRGISFDSLSNASIDRIYKRKSPGE